MINRGSNPGLLCAMRLLALLGISFKLTHAPLYTQPTSSLGLTWICVAIVCFSERDKPEEEAVAEEVAAPAVCDTAEPIEPLTDNNQNVVVLVSTTTKPPQNVTRKMASVENSPSKRAPRNKVKLAANFSFTAAP